MQASDYFAAPHSKLGKLGKSPYQGVPIVGTAKELGPLLFQMSAHPLTALSERAPQGKEELAALHAILAAMPPLKEAVTRNLLLCSLSFDDLSADLSAAKRELRPGEKLTVVCTKTAGSEFMQKPDEMCFKGDFVLPIEGLAGLGFTSAEVEGAQPTPMTGSLGKYTVMSVYTYVEPYALMPDIVSLAHVSAQQLGPDQSILAPDLSATCISFVGTFQGLPVRVLLDGGSMSNFVSQRFSREHKLDAKPLSTMVKISLADGSTSVTNCAVTGNLQLGTLSTSVGLLPTKLAHYDIILGKPWLTAHNPDINWRLNTVSLVKDEQLHVLMGERGSHLPDYLCSAFEIQDMLDAKMPVFRVDLRHLSVDPSSSHDSPELEALLNEFKAILSGLPDGLPPRRAQDHVIRMEPGSRPPASKIYNLSPAQLSELRATLKDLLDRGMIRPSESPFGAPILFVPKQDGGWRMCVDYRDLNRITVTNSFPLPRIDSILQQLQGAKFFTKLDLASGYHQIRMHPDSIERTAFKCKYGHFEYTVMPFGLKNAPATFQHVMNDTLAPFIDQFVTVYLDDILIYSKTAEEHLIHLRKVLAALRKNQFYCKRSKCLFMQQAVPYLGFLVTAEGIKINPAKLAAIRDWPSPEGVSPLRSFHGAVQYFSTFIPHFAEVSFPLTELFKKDAKWEWGPVQETAFKELKRLVTEAPCLVIADPSLPFVIHTDASDFALGGVLMQDQGRGLQPVAYLSRKFQPPERKLAAYDKELLAITECLDTWRPIILGTKFTVYTDQQALKYLLTATTKTRRQERQLSELMEFMPDIRYIPGSQNVVADALSRRADLHAVFVAPQFGADLLAEIREGYNADPRVQSFLHDGSLHWEGGMLYSTSRLLYVSPGPARAKIIRECHGVPFHGHLGTNKTKATVRRFCWWPGLLGDVQKFCTSCVTCQRTKGSTQLPYGPLVSLSIPETPWESVSMDLVTDLPVCCGHDSIFTFVDRLTKALVLVPCRKTISAPEVAQLFIDNVFRRFGMPADIVSDRDPRFTSKFWRAFTDLIETTLSMSTAYHPQTDGQTERANRTVEDMLRGFTASHQKDWCRYLALVEFAYNNSVQASTQQTPFFLNHGRHLATPLSRVVASRSPNPSATDFVEGMQAALRSAKAHLSSAQQRQKHYADKKRRPHRFQVGDKVLLVQRADELPAGLSPKLSHKFSGPYTIVEAVGSNAFRLNLPATVDKHPVINVSQLKPYVSSDVAIPDPEAPPPIRSDKRGDVYSVDSILGKREVKKGRKQVTEYLVKWTGYPLWESQWEPEKHVRHLPEDLLAAPFLSSAQVREILRPPS